MYDHKLLVSRMSLNISVISLFIKSQWYFPYLTYYKNILMADNSRVVT